MAVKVLVIDDEPDLEVLVRQRFRKQIRDGEYDFVFARNGAEALDRLRADPDVEVVLTDINMPVMDGLTLLAKIAELHRILQPVIVSAYGDMPNIRTAMNRGAFDFLTKPIDFEDFEITLGKSARQVRLLKQAAEAREQLTALQRELAVASTIQQSLLPRDAAPLRGRAEVELHAAMLPARNVGGDLFDYFALDRDRLGLVVGDVSGKGVPAALFMAVARTLARAVALRGAAPGECLREVNAGLCRDNDSGLFVTLYYGVLDLRTGELQYGNAGHPPPYVLSPGGEVRAPGTDKSGLMLGFLEQAPYATERVALRPGDALFLYTDGVTEARSPGRDLFSPERLEDVLRRAAGRTAEGLVGAVVDAVRAFAAGAPQSDDVTALAVCYRGAAAADEERGPRRGEP
jgi:sigma-B regulation protein RsbU (phosphoserine phosphatase)